MRYSTLRSRATLAGLASITAWLAVTSSCKTASNNPGLDDIPPGEDAGPVGQPPIGPQGYFEFRAFREKIQPILDTADNRGCTAGACHGAPDGAGGFKLTKEPAADSPEELDNFNKVKDRADLEVPNDSLIYKRAKTKHAGGGSALASDAEQQTILQWIQEAKAAKDADNQPAPDGGAGDGGGGGGGCVSPDTFSLGTFKSDILPILTGQKDYNRADQVGNGAGCASGSCHGVDRPGALVLKKNASAEENLKSFACYVNLASPVQSNIVLCPLNRNACKKFPHPGNAFFTSPDDLNYQKVLSFLYAGKQAATPLDFAFFARQVAPIFADTAVTGGRACADTVGCHGVTSQTQGAPGGSDFPMVVGAIDKNRLGFNFSSASSFANFIGEPEDSYLFLYPTNEIARNPKVDPGASPFATGRAHTGGKLFPASSDQARLIQTWTQGLRLTNSGLQPNWLVAGEYNINNINTQTGVGPEDKIAPQIFDKMGAAKFNNGEWDGLFSQRNDAFVDLNQPFPGGNQDRAAYAMAYLINTTSNDIQALVTIRSDNEILMYADQNKVLTSLDARSGQTAPVTITALSANKKSTRLLVKVLQRAGQSRFGFTCDIKDSNGNLIGSDDVIIKLSPDGGI